MSALVGVEIEKEFGKARAYLVKAQKYKEHADKPWIEDNTLARWLYIGSKQVVKDFEEDVVRFADTQGKSMYQNCISKLKSILNRTETMIEQDFPNDCLIREALA